MSDISTRPHRPQLRLILGTRKLHSLETDIVTRLYLRTTHGRGPIPARARHVTLEINKRNVADQHLARAAETPVISGVLGDVGPDGSAFDMKVLEQDITDDSPATPVREAGGLVGGLWGWDANPGLDVGRVVHVFVVSEDIDISYHDVFDGGVFKVLAQASYRDPVTAVAGYVLGVDVVGSRLDSYAVVSALINEIAESDVVRVHGIKPIRILDPIGAIGGV